MSLRIIGKNCLLLSSLVLTASFTYAKPNDKVPCPSASLIQQSAPKLDKAIKIEASDKYGYVALTFKPAFYENNLPWYVMAVTPKSVKSPEEAIREGKKITGKTNIKKTQYAKKFDGKNVICEYGPGFVAAVGGDLSSPSVFNFKR